MDPTDASPLRAMPARSSPELPPSRPSLLPAFEPTNSSPTLSRPGKRKFSGSRGGRTSNIVQYPTPVPTSSTDIIPTSPPAKAQSTRPGLQRTASAVSERVPLGDVASVDLPADGKPILFGRSSNSSQYQLSANRLISRVHVKAQYEPGVESRNDSRIRIECMGWNGARLHCKGQAYELGKGDTFTADRPDAEIMLDVQDARVLIRWPVLARTGSLSAFTDGPSDEEASPDHARTTEQSQFPSSPPVHLRSPISPSPKVRPDFNASSTFIGLPASSSHTASVEVYEDSSSGDEEVDPAAQLESPSQRPVCTSARLQASQISSTLSSPESVSDRDEENDPIITSFGPFGDNLLPRMASIHAVSPERRREPLRASVSPRQPKAIRKDNSALKQTLDVELSPIRNHVINQLAFSRLHALPLSVIMEKLPSSLKQGNSKRSTATADEKSDDKDLSIVPRIFKESDLKQLLDETPCVGEIPREGKDASGKKLQNEFYYVPEMDSDQMRKEAVENSLGKSGLRAVRKQHKQYYWKRPRN